MVEGEAGLLVDRPSERLWIFGIHQKSKGMKVIPLHQPEGKMSIAECRKILNKNGNNYTDQEIEEIRDFLYLLTEIEIENYKTKVSNEKEKLHSLHQGEYR